MNKKNNAIRIVQITDTHIASSKNPIVNNINTRLTLQNIIQHIKKNISLIEYIIVTGDLVEDDSIQNYYWLKKIMDQMNKHYYWTAGNHDNPDHMNLVAPKARIKHIKSQSWNLINLDTYQKNKSFGYLNKESLQFLNTQLTNNPKSHTIIALHHPPIKINSKWIDKINLDNSADFWKIINKHTQVKIIICGHVHQESKHIINNVTVLTTPSTAFQFKPGQSEFKMDKMFCGYRTIDLLPNGNFESNVIKISI